MLRPASAHTTSRSMKSGKSRAMLDLPPRDAAAEIDVRREIAEDAAGQHHRPEQHRCRRAARRRGQKGRERQRDRRDGAGEKEQRRRARIEIAGLDQPAAQFLGLAGVLGRIMLGGVVDQPLRRDLAGVAQRARIVGRCSPCRCRFRPRAASPRSAPAITAIMPNASAAADRNTNALTIRSELSPPDMLVHELEHGVHVRSGNCTSCT